MDEKIYLYLSQILDSIHAIDNYLGEQRDFSSFQNSRILRKAIEREIEVIGEATRRILDVQDDFPISNARQIIGTRNNIVHGYDKVDEAMIWSIILKHLPILKTEVESLLLKD